jgi:PAS domain S-box-containing protein
VKAENPPSLTDSGAMQRFSQIFQACPVALGISTLTDGRIVDINERWLAMFGYVRDQVIGRTNADLNLMPQPGARADHMRQLRAAGALREVEVQARTRSGVGMEMVV